MCIANLNCGLQKKQAQFLVKSMCTNSSIENYLMKSDELDLTLQDFTLIQKTGPIPRIKT